MQRKGHSRTQALHVATLSEVTLTGQSLNLQTLAETLQERGVALKATQQPVDTSTAAGKAFFQMLGVFSEFETNLRKERQIEGIEKAKRAGVYKGRKPSIDVAEVRRLKDEGIGATTIAQRLGIARTSVYRASKCIDNG